MNNRAIFCLVFLILAIAFVGCSEKTDYKVGIYSISVDGSIQKSEGLTKDNAFILVINHHRTLLETSEGYLHRVTASIVHPNKNGAYSARFDTDTTTLDIRVFARNSLVESQRFHRSLGIGRYIYNVSLKTDDNWGNNYYLLIKPYLIDFITEERYLMSKMDKLFIGNWLSDIEDQL